MVSHNFYYLIKHVPEGTNVCGPIDLRDVSFSFLPVSTDDKVDMNNVLGNYIADMFSGSVIVGLELVPIPVVI